MFLFERLKVTIKHIAPTNTTITGFRCNLQLCIVLEKTWSFFFF